MKSTIIDSNSKTWRLQKHLAAKSSLTHPTSTWRQSVIKNVRLAVVPSFQNDLVCLEHLYLNYSDSQPAQTLWVFSLPHREDLCEGADICRWYNCDKISTNEKFRRDRLKKFSQACLGRNTLSPCWATGSRLIYTIYTTMKTVAFHH